MAGLSLSRVQAEMQCSYTLHMTSRVFHFRHLDVEAFAQQAADMAGEIPLSALSRLADCAASEAKPSVRDSVSWQAHGESRRVRGGASQTWLHLSASADIALTCQRCLQPMTVQLDMQRSLRFVQGEDAAAAIDAESEDDVLALTRSMDLQELLEDELLLVLPLVPRHEQCPQPLPMAAKEEPLPEERENPFAVLAGLKARRTVN
jgi:uncharacterized protein